jgi:hypothetical protein
MEPLAQKALVLRPQYRFAGSPAGTGKMPVAPAVECH